MRKFRRTKATLVPEALPERRQRSKKIWALAVIIVMAMSVVGFLTIDFSGSERYNGFKLINIDGNSWKVTKIPDLVFLSHPADVESVPLTEEFMAMLRAVPVLTIAAEPTDRNAQAINSVAYDLVWPFAQQEHVLRFTAGNKSFSCDNATSFLPVLELKTGVPGAARAFARNSSSSFCYTFTAADTRDFVEFRDRLVYGIYGVIPDDTYEKRFISGAGANQ